MSCHHLLLVPARSHSTRVHSWVHKAPPHSVLSQPLATTHVHSDFMDLPLPNISYKWNHVMWSRVCEFFHLCIFKVNLSCTPCISTSYLMTEEKLFYGYITNLFIHSTTVCLISTLLAIVNSGVITCRCVSSWQIVFSSLRNLPRSAVAGSSMLNDLKSCQTVPLLSSCSYLKKKKKPSQLLWCSKISGILTFLCYHC